MAYNERRKQAQASGPNVWQEIAKAMPEYQAPTPEQIAYRNANLARPTVGSQDYEPSIPYDYSDVGNLLTQGVGQEFSMTPPMEQGITDSITNGQAGVQRSPASMPQQVGNSNTGAAMNSAAYKSLGNKIDAEKKSQEKQQTDYEKKVRDYMTKREGIALDMQNRMAKLDSMYNNQGPDLSAFGMLADEANMQQGIKSNYMGNFQKGRMSAQQLEELKQKLAMQQNGVYGNLDKTARDMYRMDLTSQMADKARGSREDIANIKAAGKGKKPLTGDSLKRYGQMSSVRDGIQLVQNALNKGLRRSAVFGTGLLGGIGANELDDAYQQMFDNLAHSSTGAAVSQTEEKLYKAMLPQAGERKSRSDQKLRLLDLIMKRRMSDLRTGGEYTPLSRGMMSYVSKGGIISDAGINVLSKKLEGNSQGSMSLADKRKLAKRRFRGE